MKSSCRLRSLLSLILCHALLAACLIPTTVTKAESAAQGDVSSMKNRNERRSLEPLESRRSVNVGPGFPLAHRAVGVDDKEQVYGFNLFRSLVSSPYVETLPFNAPVSAPSSVTVGGLYSSFDFLAPSLPQVGGGKIVFASNRDGRTQIYLMNADGSGQIKLTGGNGNDDNPRWSPDGTAILFQSDRDNSDTGYNDIYVMDAGGNGQTRLTTDSNDDSSAAWSPDGRMVVFQSLRGGTFYQIYSMNADGTSQLNLSNSGSNDRQPSWSPDGSKIAFASERDHVGFASIYVMNADGSQQTRLTWSDAPFRDEQPVWSPDGMKLAFTSTRDSVIESWQETDEEGGVVQRSDVRTNREVYVMNADGSNQVRLTNSLGNDDSPDWSPDGTQIIFRSDREQDCCDPTSQVWVMSADGTGQVNLSGNQFGDYSSSWTASGGGGGKPLPAADASAAQANKATIDFNNLAANVIVTNQYLPYVTFSGNGFSAGSRYPYGVDVITRAASNFSSDRSIIARDNYNAQWDGDGANSTLFADFKLPVNNLSFYVLNSLNNDYEVIDIYVWVSGQYYGSYYVPGNGYRGNPGPPIKVDLSSISQITGIKIVPNSNSANVIYPNTPYPIYYDDFSFTPDLNVDITNPRVSGNLQGTTRNALLGADVRLQAVPNRSGGTYSWSISGGEHHQHISTSADQTATLDRWTEPGTYKATVSYTLNGVTVSSSIDINVIVPTMTDFTANIEDPDDIFIGDCARGYPVAAPTAYQLGCSDLEVEHGIFFTATVQIPPGEYLSDPGQSGIKFKQGISTFRKRMNAGSVECYTKRTSDSDVASGWQLDTDETYNHIAHPPRYFYQSNTIFIRDFDSPGTVLAGKNIVGLVPYMYDAVFVDERFEMYVYYFTGPNPDSPNFQRPLKLANSSLPVARAAWGWGGQVVFDSSVAETKYRKQFSSTILGPQPVTGTGAVVSFQTNFRDNEWGRCPGGPPPTTTRIDSTRFFVDQHYLDFLNRASDQSGSDFWTSNITPCGFDMACISRKRVDVSRAFFYSGEFVGLHPELGGQRGTHEYNAAFVLQCYHGFLRREPNAPPDNNWDGFNYWVNKLDSTNPDAGDWKYSEMIKAFIESIEYRARFAQ